jgi:hypothetical protein
MTNETNIKEMEKYLFAQNPEIQRIIQGYTDMAQARSAVTKSIIEGNTRDAINAMKVFEGVIANYAGMRETKELAKGQLQGLNNLGNYIGAMYTAEAGRLALQKRASQENLARLGAEITDLDEAYQGFRSKEK